MSILKTLIAVLFISSAASAQVISTGIPAEIKKSDKYLFYLHGHLVTVLGDNAVQQSYPEWGPYEYSNILDSLRGLGFNVISENRKEGIDNAVYVNKILAQVDSLFKGGVKPKNILLVGASAGWDIVLRAAAKLKNKKMKYVIMGGCWPETYKDYTGLKLYGKFLSIIETTDPHGTCSRIFEGRKSIKSFKEIKLNTGLSHGFFYKGRKEWIDPIAEWFKGS